MLCFPTGTGASNLTGMQVVRVLLGSVSRGSFTKRASAPRQPFPSSMIVPKHSTTGVASRQGLLLVGVAIR